MLNKARESAQIENGLRALRARYPVVRTLDLVNPQIHSVRCKLRGVQRLALLLQVLLGDGNEARGQPAVSRYAEGLPRIHIRLGSRRGVVFVASSGTLYLPLDFDMADVAAKLKQ